MKVCQLLAPSSTIFRVKRKRSADPLAGLVISKRQRIDNVAEADLPSTSDKAAISDVNNKEASEIFFLLAGTSDLPGGKDAVRFLDRIHKVVEMVDYNPEGKELGKRRISVLDRQYLEVIEVAKGIINFGIEEQEKKDFERESTAPLASAEMDDEGLPSTLDSIDHKEYVYDFYCPADSRTGTITDDNYVVRLPTDEEMQLYFGGDDESDSDGAVVDDDDDSNDENYYKNEYPDEDEFGCENDTTSDDDSYDHYGDETVEYDGICHDSDIRDVHLSP